MKRIFVLSISLILLAEVSGQVAGDSALFRRTLSFGFEVTGPVISSVVKNRTMYEGYVAYRISHKHYLVAEAGYGSLSHEQYNYSYHTSGPFLRAGIDFNLLKPELKSGNHYAGIGLRYGMAIAKQETPFYSYENYWGTYESSIPGDTYSGHYLQLSGGVKAEAFRNLFLGWTIRMNLLVYQSAGKTNRPVMVPGMGTTDRGVVPGISFHVGWILPLPGNGTSPAED